MNKVILAILSVLVFHSVYAATKLPSYGKVAAFTLTSQNNKPFTEKDLQGKIWVADFIYTRCTDLCPLLSYRMSGLQKVFSKDNQVRLVSFTLDPWHDSPAVLARYAKGYGAKSGRWYFLTGRPPALAAVGANSFHFFMAKDFRRDQVGKTGHAGRFALVDAGGTIRGYYDSDKKADLSKLIQDVKRLASGS